MALKKDENLVQTTNHLVACKTSNNNTENDCLKQHCSSCRKLLKTKSEKFSKNNTCLLAPSPAPAPSPRVSHNKVSEKESEFKDLDVDRTPSFVRGGNKFFGIPLSDSSLNSPRWMVRTSSQEITFR